ncbi:hypothetical protein FRB90_010124, partial [Tulasnella sp. 427]
VANCLLYRHIELDKHVHRATLLLSTLTDHPSLVAHIKSFDCSAIPSRCRVPELIATSFDLRSSSELLVRVLRNAVALTSLVVSVDVDDVEASREGWLALLRGPIELRRLVLCGKKLPSADVDGPKQREAWTDLIADLVKAQPSVTDLEIRGFELTGALPRLDPTDLPNLERFTASSMPALRLVLQNRPRSPKSITLGEQISINQVRDPLITRLIPDGEAVEEFTWERSDAERRMSAVIHSAYTDEFLLELSARFPNVRKIALPQHKGFWKREDGPHVEWTRVILSVDELLKKEEEQSRGMFKRDLNPIGLTHRCYP